MILNNLKKDVILSVKNLGISFKNGKEKKIVLDDINLDVGEGEIVSIIGPSGCGKSTLLSAIGGINSNFDGDILFKDEKVSSPSSDRGYIFQRPALFDWMTVEDNISAIGGINSNFDGDILFKDEKVSSPSSDRGYIFQRPALFDWMTVEDNIGYGLKLKKFTKEEISSKVDEFVKEIGLDGYKKYHPKHLSGGMQQRVALARVLIMKPDMLLMDEPFSALDYQTRIEMQNLTLKLWELYKPSIIFITHDIEEAILMADRVIVLSKNPGRIVETIDIDFERPRNIDILSNVKFMEIKKELLKKLIL